MKLMLLTILVANLSICKSSPVRISDDLIVPESAKEQNVDVMNTFLRILMGEPLNVNEEFNQMKQLSDHIRLIEDISDDPSIAHDKIVIIEAVPFVHEIFSEISDDNAKPGWINNESSSNDEQIGPNVSVVSNGRTGFVVLNDESNSEWEPIDFEPILIGGKEKKQNPIASSEVFEILWIMDKPVETNEDVKKSLIDEDNYWSTCSLKRPQEFLGDEIKDKGEMFDDERASLEAFFKMHSERNAESKNKNEAARANDESVVDSQDKKVEDVANQPNEAADVDQEIKDEVFADEFVESYGELLNVFEDEQERGESISELKDESVNDVAVGEVFDDRHQLEMDKEFSKDEADEKIDLDSGADEDVQAEQAQGAPQKPKNVPAIEMSGGILTKLKHIFSYFF